MNIFKKLWNNYLDSRLCVTCKKHQAFWVGHIDRCEDCLQAEMREAQRKADEAEDARLRRNIVKALRDYEASKEP